MRKPLIVVPMRWQPGRYITNYFMQHHHVHDSSAWTALNMLFIYVSWDHWRNLRNIWFNLKWDGNIFPAALWSQMFCETIAGSSFERGKIFMERKMQLFVPRLCFPNVLQGRCGINTCFSRTVCCFAGRRFLDLFVLLLYYKYGYWLLLVLVVVVVVVTVCWLDLLLLVVWLIQSGYTQHWRMHWHQRWNLKSSRKRITTRLAQIMYIYIMMNIKLMVHLLN